MINDGKPFATSVVASGDHVRFELMDDLGRVVAWYDSDDHSFKPSPEEAMAALRLLENAPATAAALSRALRAADSLLALADWSRAERGLASELGGELLLARTALVTALGEP